MNDTAEVLQEHEFLNDAPDAGTCLTSTECHPDIVFTSTGERMLRSGRYCQKPIGQCDGKGTCEWNTEIVLDIRHFVCGCDGKSYGNWTHASAHGMNIAHDGECSEAPLRETPPPSTEFDKRTATRLIMETAKTAETKCYRPGAPTGSGRAVITFDTNGHVSNVSVLGQLAGSAVASCIERHFRAIVMPPFDGKPVSVGKAFSIGPVVH
jgi:hypothetical protein